MALKEILRIFKTLIFTYRFIKRFADTPEKRAEVLAATTQACEALWGFLDGIYESYCSDLDCERMEAVTLH